MPVHSLTPILNVSSIAESFRWFQALGWQPGFAWNDGGEVDTASARNEHGPAMFGSVCSGAVEIFLCVGAQGSRGTVPPKFPGDDETDGVWMSWWVQSLDELDALHRLAVESNANVSYPPTDEPWGVREFHLRHPDGHTFRVSSSLQRES
jgi:uncharacterized glyoxalase superfamily protein PhnB